MNEQNAGADPQRSLAAAQGNEQASAPQAQSRVSDSPGNGAAQSADPAGNTQAAADPPLWQRLGYPDADTAERSVLGLRSYASEVKDNETRLRQELETLRAQQAGGGARMNPAGLPGQQPSPGVDPLTELETSWGVPRALLRPAIEQAAREQVQTFLSPFAQAAEADQRAIQKFGPAYLQDKPKIEAFLATHPDVQGMVNAARMNGLPDLANEFAVTKFREAFYDAQHGAITSAAGATQRATEAARSHAGVLAGGRGEETRNRASGNTDATPIDRDEAIRRYNAGDDTLMMQKAAQSLPWSEEFLQGVMQGKIIIP